DGGALRRIVVFLDMEMDEAFAARSGRLRWFKFDKAARGVALDQEHRMKKRADLETAAVEFADNRIHQKLHVIIYDFKHRNAACATERLEPYLGRSGGPLEEKRPRLLGNACQHGRAAMPQIFRRGEPEQFGDKTVRHGGFPLGQELGGSEKRVSAALIACGIGLSVHVFSAYDAQ